MQLQVSPNRWSCMLTSFAMVLDESAEELIAELGHDGSEIIWPEMPEPYRRRSFHWQELQDLAIQRGWAVTCIEARPCSLPGRCRIPDGESEPLILDLPIERFVKYLDGNVGVMTGIGGSLLPHAVAWDGTRIFDPAGSIYAIGEGPFTVREFSWFARMR